jgi:thiol-disulfide isomerase/thioredoxin
MNSIKHKNTGIKKLVVIVFIILTGCKSPQSFHLKGSGSSQIIIGSANKLTLQTHQNTNWFEPNYLAYKPDSSTLVALKKHLPQTQVLIFAGTWCSDTQRELPQFYKVADALGLNPNQIELQFLDENKKGFYLNESVFKVSAVPTFIFMREGKEIGRIIEMTTQPFEKEWLGLYQLEPKN